MMAQKDVWIGIVGMVIVGTQIQKEHFRQGEVFNEIVVAAVKSLSMFSDMNDKLIWKIDRKGLFSISSCYSSLVSKKPLFFPVKLIGNLRVSSKVWVFFLLFVFFSWEAT